jgi:hypothetical protein
MENEMETIEEILEDRITLKEKQLVKFIKIDDFIGITRTRVTLDELHIVKNKLAII